MRVLQQYNQEKKKENQYTKTTQLLSGVNGSEMEIIWANSLQYAGKCDRHVYMYVCSLLIIPISVCEEKVTLEINSYAVLMPNEYLKQMVDT